MKIHCKNAGLILATKQVILSIACLVMAASLHGQQPKFKLHWDEGIRLDANNNAYKARIGGRIMYDIASFDQHPSLNSAYGHVRSGSEFRRLRLFHAATFHSLKYKAQFEFAGERVRVKDLYVELTDLAVVGNVRIGHFKEPFLLEMLTSSKYTTFMERAIPTVFAGDRNAGVMLHNRIKDAPVFWQIAAFQNGEQDKSGARINFGYNFMGRLSGLAWQSESHTSFLHLGAGVRHRTLRDKVWGIAVRPESHLAPKYLNTGSMDHVRSLSMATGEILLQLESFSLQSEYVHTRVQVVPETMSAYTFPAWYTQLSYMITGESRNFMNCNSGFGRIRPHNNLGKGGPGAWEFAIRYSRANLETALAHGNALDNLSLGLNWYLNPQMRFMANYLFVEVNDMGHASVFQLRGQIEF